MIYLKTINNKMVVLFALLLSLLLPNQLAHAMPVDPLPNDFAERQVTRQEVIDFLLKDKTNEHERIEGVYACENYALDLQLAGRAYNIDIYRIGVWFNGGVGHMFNAVDTVDAGTIYIEPQDDLPYNKPIVGEYLCYPKNMWAGGESTCVEYDDFIIEEVMEYHTTRR